MNNFGVDCTVNPLAQIFSDPGHYVIPDYQRGFAWKATSIKRLLSDIYQCIGSYAKNPASNATMFLGSIITVRGPEFSIIDGQQRLSTLSLIMSVLIRRFLYVDSILLGNYAADLKTDDTLANFVHVRLRQEIMHLMQLISEQYFFNSQYYQKPRIHRQDDALASTDPQNPDKTIFSALTLYLYKSINLSCEIDKKLMRQGASLPQSTAENKESSQTSFWKKYKRFTLNDKELQKNAKAQSTGVGNAVNHIEDIFDYICHARYFLSDRNNPSINTTDRKAFAKMEALFEDSELGKLDIAKLAGLITLQLPAGYSEEQAAENCCFMYSALELMLFSKIFQERVLAAFISTPNEEYAFQMFDSLNTTGVILTAYETYRAQIVNTESRYTPYEKSPLKPLIEEIDNYLNEDRDSTKGSSSSETIKKERTNGLLISFALASTGDKLPSALASQRKYLKNVFNKYLEQPATRGDLVYHLYLTCSFWRDVWFAKLDNGGVLSFTVRNLQGQRSAAISCPADVTYAVFTLCKAKHVIVAPFLIKFYSLIAYNLNESGKLLQAKQLFFDAVRAAAAFSTLYRSAFGGTNGIDSVYRELFADKSLCWFLTPPAADDLEQAGELLQHAKETLIQALHDNEELDNKAIWKEHAANVHIYEDAAWFAVLMLVMYWVKKYCNGVFSDTDLLLICQNNSVEHVAPQDREEGVKASDKWPDDIYEEGKEQTLGNLALVNASLNSVLSNHTRWVKFPLYRCFLYKDDAEHAADVAQAKQDLQDQQFDLKTLEKYKAVAPQSFLQDVAAKDSWSKADIEQRTDEILEAVWSIADKWLFH